MFTTRKVRCFKSITKHHKTLSVLEKYFFLNCIIIFSSNFFAFVSVTEREQNLTILNYLQSLHIQLINTNWKFKFSTLNTLTTRLTLQLPSKILIYKVIKKFKASNSSQSQFKNEIYTTTNNKHLFKCKSKRIEEKLNYWIFSKMTILSFMLINKKKHLVKNI